MEPLDQWLERNTKEETSFTLSLYGKEGSINNPELIIELLESSREFVLPEYHFTEISGSPRGGEKYYSMKYSEKKWKEAKKKIREGKYWNVGLYAYKEGNNQKDSILISFYRLPESGSGWVVPDRVTVTTSLDYLKSLEISRKISSIINFAKRTWECFDMSYGYGNIGVYSEDNWMLNEELMAQRDSPIPIAMYDINFLNNIQGHFKDKVLGAYWINFLSAIHIKQIGGVQKIKDTLKGEIVEELPRGGAMIILTPLPIIEETPENWEKFIRLKDLLKPILAPKPKIPKIWLMLQEEKKKMGIYDKE